MAQIFTHKDTFVKPGTFIIIGMMRVEVALPKGYEELLPEKVYELAERGIEVKEDGDSTRLIIYSSRPDEVLKEILRVCADASYSVEEYIPLDYVENFLRSFKPIKVGNLSILCPWHRPKGKGRFIFIEPGIAFGTGRHESTKLALHLMQVCDFGGRDVVDLGCGSGILSICASILGAKQVLAIDKDPCAYEATLKNLSYNRIGNVCVELKDIREVSGEFDFILANLDFRSFNENLEKIISLSKVNGTLIFSGLLEGEGTKIVKNPRVSVIKRRRLSSWEAYILKRII